MERTILKLADALKLSEKNGLFFGICGNYAVCFVEGQSGLALYIDYSLNAADQIKKDSLRSLIKQAADTCSVSSFQITDTGARIVIKKSEKPEKILCLFGEIIQFLKKHEIPGVSLCSNCGKPVENPVLIFFSGAIHSCDASCADRILDYGKSNLSTVKNKTKKVSVSELINTVLGALFGMVIGSALVMILYSVGIRFAATMLLIALCVKAGAFLFRGDNGIPGFLIMLSFSSIGVLITRFLCEWRAMTALWRANGFVYSIGDSIQVAFNYMLSHSDALLSYLSGCILGFLIVLCVLGAMIRIRPKKTVSFPSIVCLKAENE